MRTMHAQVATFSKFAIGLVFVCDAYAVCLSSAEVAGGGNAAADGWLFPQCACVLLVLLPEVASKGSCPLHVAAGTFFDIDWWILMLGCNCAPSYLRCLTIMP